MRSDARNGDRSWILIVIGIVLLQVQCSPPGTSSVPEWARHAIWYQIFPERFRNGDPANDPTATDIRGSWPHSENSRWQISSWTGDWYARQSWERDQKPFYFHVQQRRYGGDLQGVLEKLPYLQSLGVNALYFNPLFESPSLHKYDATMYHHIDNNFGPNPAGDAAIWREEDPIDPKTWRWTSADSLFLVLIRECHRLDIRVIVDGVFNHVGMTFWAFEDVRRRGSESSFRNWFTVTSFDDPSTPEDEFAYEGWAGVAELPELREDSLGLLPPIREHIFDVVTRWMDPNGDGDPSDGIDGWRLDVAEKVNMNFWRLFRAHVRSLNPEAYMVGEVWWEDWEAGKMYNAAPWLQGDVFDAVMNYRLAGECISFFAGRTSAISATEFVSRIESIQKDYPADAGEVLLNLYDSHDTDRLLSRVVNPDLEYDHRVGAVDNPSYLVRKPTEEELRIVRLLVMFQMTYIGAPSIYAGTESGMWGGDDPDCRKPMLWDDLVFDSERAHPFGEKRTPDANEVDTVLRTWYRSMANFRHAHESIRTGACSVLLVDDTERVVSLLRKNRKEAVALVFNASNKEVTVSINIPDDLGVERWERGPGHGSWEQKGEQVQVRLPAKSGLAMHGSRS